MTAASRVAATPIRRATSPSSDSRAAETIAHPMPSTDASRLPDALLRIFADALDDLERTRIATENRVRALLQAGLAAEAPEVVSLLELITGEGGITQLEHRAELKLKHALRKHPLGSWVRTTVGIGEKQGARLLAAIGDPVWNDAAQRPRRGPAELWAYCGFNVVAPRQPWVEPHLQDAGGDVHPTAGAHPTAGVAPSHRRGQQSNWNDAARMRAFLVAESCIKQRASPYRAVYDAGRAKYAESLHAHPCVRCGPAKHPALEGSALSDGHKHARALRLVAKAILRDLFLVARDHDPAGSHTGRVAGDDPFADDQGNRDAQAARAVRKPLAGSQSSNDTQPMPGAGNS